MIKKVLILTTFALYAQEPHYYPIMIIGGGIAGLSAAIYAGNARIPTALCVGPCAGGQLAIAGIVENMPGVPAQHGQTIIDQLETQAAIFGTQIISDSVVSICTSGQPYRFLVTTQEGTLYATDALVIATGAKPRTLGVPGEQEYWGLGVSTCAICDGPLARNKDVVVIGGGDSAIEEALQLAPYARHITILLRSNGFRASPRMQEKLADHTHITYRYDVEVQEIVGDSHGMTGVKVYDKITKECETISAQGFFLAIGQEPETECIRNLVNIDKYGYIVLYDRQKTSQEGVYAAGDVTNTRYRQAIVAAGDAAKAAMEAVAFLRGID